MSRAQYDGPCQRCNGRIHVGDDIEPHPDGSQHATCLEVDDYDATFLGDTRDDACPTCWLIHKGECP
ncbi:hypothetical protein SEA_AYOTOYA_72 [Gordonia phage Ayotoya]|nr:hypothetical protein SEA_AYOTOYA_72 [Gordonia phage Ayotoya]URP21300.1 hypothetical protein SEA_CHOP_73 [Gordonia phage Chop]UXL91348.1 hypothetical protein SEA_GRANDSLAM_73 [Gordonia phage GrandSlam]